MSWLLNARSNHSGHAIAKPTFATGGSGSMADRCESPPISCSDFASQSGSAQMQTDKKNSNPFVWLPCLKCGQHSVPIPTMFLPTDGRGTTWNCRNRPCETEHFLSVGRLGGAFVIAYQRYTLRYPLQYYDEGTMPFNIRVYRRKPREGQLDDSGYVGPVVVYPRKKRFSPTEVKGIWQATRGRCHISRRRWQLAQPPAHGRPT